MSPKDAAAFLLFLGVFVFVGVVLYLIFEWTARQRRVKAQGEVAGRLLDKFGTARELIEFLQSPGNTRFISAISGDGYSPAREVLRTLHRGIILLLLGIGCLGLHLHYGETDNPLLVFAVILSCLGIGFLISAAVTYRLAKSLGLDNHANEPQPFEDEPK
jgi:hypothetical protein